MGSSCGSSARSGTSSKKTAARATPLEPERQPAPAAPAPPARRLRLGVIFSGGGRTLENLSERIRDGSLPATIAVAISSHQDAGGIERARRQSIPLKVIDYR